MSKPQELQTIDTAALAQVSGGVAQVPPTTSTDPLLTALSDILDSLKTLGQQNTGGGINQQEMLMFMMLSQKNQQSAPVAVVPAARYWYY